MNRHRLANATLAVAIVCFFGYSSAQGVWIESSLAVAHAHSVTERILNKEASYADVLEMVKEAKQLRSAYTVASQSEVAWSSMLGLVAGSLPEGGALTSLNLTAPSALESSVSSAPLSGKAILVTATVSITSPTFAGVEYFLLDAKQWPGYSNAVISSVTKQGDAYLATMTMYMDSQVLNHATVLSSLASSGGVQ